MKTVSLVISMPPNRVDSPPEPGNTMADEEEEDEDEDGGVLFYVNKSGFPINNLTCTRMYKHVCKLNPQAKKVVKNIPKTESLPDIPVPQAPLSFPPNTLVEDRLDIVQKYMSELQYNHTGTQFFEIRKNRPISGLMDSAKEMIRESLPIKCLEAVILGLYLTLGTPALDRFPISFKTTFNGNTYRHVVLGLYSLGRYGALGMSRRDDLMNKPLKYKSLSDLLKDYKSSYEKYWHTVKKIKIGVPVSHDPHSYEHINWKQLSLSVPKLTMEEMSRELDRHARDMRTQTKKREILMSVYSPPKARPVTTAGPSPHPIRKSLNNTHKANDGGKHGGKHRKSDRSPVKRSVSEDKPRVVIDHVTDHVTKPTKPASEPSGERNLDKPITGGYQLRI